MQIKVEIEKRPGTILPEVLRISAPGCDFMAAAQEFTVRREDDGFTITTDVGVSHRFGLK